MTRVPGSTDAKRAWVHLRGPYFLAYLSYLVFTLVIPSDGPPPGRDWWAIPASIIGVMLIMGASASWMVVSNFEPRKMWRKVELMEVTSLRMLVFLELAVAIWRLLDPEAMVFNGVFHLLIAFMFGGILSNLTWHRTRTGTDGRARVGR